MISPWYIWNQSCWTKKWSNHIPWTWRQGESSHLYFLVLQYSQWSSITNDIPAKAWLVMLMKNQILTDVKFTLIESDFLEKSSIGAVSPHETRPRAWRPFMATASIEADDQAEICFSSPKDVRGVSQRPPTPHPSFRISTRHAVPTKAHADQSERAVALGMTPE